MKMIRLIAGYLYLGKGKELETGSKPLQMMHRMNRVSLFMFLFCLLVIVSKFVARAFLQ